MMSEYSPEIQEATIVLVGDFNPKIFQPAWFASHDLLREQEAEAADINIIHHEIVQFSLEWLNLTVTGDRFVAASSTDSHYEIMRDLVLGCLKLLSHTPIEKLGINRQMHYRVSSAEQMNQLGYWLVPKEPWLGVFEKPAMSSLTVQNPRKDPLGYAQLQIAPSARVFPGVYLAANSHYEVSGGAEAVIRIIEDEWEGAMIWPLGVMDSLMSGVS